MSTRISHQSAVLRFRRSARRLGPPARLRGLFTGRASLWPTIEHGVDGPFPDSINPGRARLPTRATRRRGRGVGRRIGRRGSGQLGTLHQNRRWNDHRDCPIKPDPWCAGGLIVTRTVDGTPAQQP